jgi:formate hydrogenlyase transcriptional activator
MVTASRPRHHVVVLHIAHGEGMMDDALSNQERILVDSAVLLTSKLDVQRICAATLDAVERLCGARSAWVMLIDEGRNELVTMDFRGVGGDSYAGVRVPSGGSALTSLVFSRREALFIPDTRQETRWFDARRVHRSGLQSVLLVPLMFDGEPVGVIGLDSPRFRRDQPPSPADLARLTVLGAHATVAIRNARLVASIEQDRSRLRRLLNERRQLRHEVDHLRDAVRDAHAYHSVLGESDSWRAVLEEVQLVAPADSTVLLLGETGTGKELIARAIHEQSRRRRQPFVAINCAAFPESLVESELFGHERGAFTGAFERKPGKFELADKGTLFLDEVGELPAPVQAKLLRALQEREVQRVGGTKPIAINVRLIAATNRDLQESLRDGTFRQDLYYRLNVFPLKLPPLRDRGEDVTVLARHFVHRFAERQRRRAPDLTPAAVAALRSYHWPGNVRELQNVLERAMILCRGRELSADLLHLPAHDRQLLTIRATPPLRAVAADRPPSTVISFSEAERRAIVKALETTGWRISGRGGAADLLGLKPTTLHAKMKRLGVRRPSGADIERPRIAQPPA